jgi:hypothetical protein
VLGHEGERHDQRTERSAQQPPREAVAAAAGHDDAGDDAGHKPGSQEGGQDEWAGHDRSPSRYDGAGNR